MSAASGTATAAVDSCTRTIPPGYADVDPRTASRVRLSHELSTKNPVFPGDPPFKYETFTTIAQSGYLLERITSLGTHLGTHISSPAHFIEDGATLNELSEFFSLMPVAVIDVRKRLASEGGSFILKPADLKAWEERHGQLPRRGCVLLLTGFGERFREPLYSKPAPGFSGNAVEWMFEERGVLAVGSDTFGPDASSDEQFSATSTALAKGGITVENIGPGLAKMRPHGDWIAINCARPAFGGFPAGITGYTKPTD